MMKRLVALGAVLAACTPRGPSMQVPRAADVPVIDGKLDEPAWKLAARTGAFPGGPPFTEARFLHDAAHLYVALYAADEDIAARAAPRDTALYVDDHFSIRIGDRQIDVNAAGSITDVVERGGAIDPSWTSGIALAIDRDGTLDDRGDTDEEWTVEAAIPLAPLGRLPLEVHITRCDTPRRGERVCETWGGEKRSSAFTTLRFDR